MSKDDLPHVGGDSYEKPYGGVPRVDPSVRVGPLQGPQNGEVDMATTMCKPQAYKVNRYSKGMGNE